MIDRNNIYQCRVVKILPTYVLLDFPKGQGICHISEISDYHVNDINRFFKVNETYDFILLKNDDDHQKNTFSFKRIHPKLLKNHREIIDSTSGFETLYQKTIKALD
ncbi:MAG: S1 RNA-binding domain-containing protein [Mycoplasmataceae bacterium]|jgi:predicted RNA-binding protein with RPS1 domain|nr:S1 RNA-binding domain-containing protein [Mycoplasmataceae bacterium]